MSNYAGNKNQHLIDPIVLRNVIIPANRIKSDGTETHNRNFSGKKYKPFNENGTRSFTIIVDPEQVDIPDLQAKGWPIKAGENKTGDPNFIPNYYLRVKVQYHPEGTYMAKYNPKVAKVNSAGTLTVDEDNIGALDSDDIIKANMTLTGRWNESPTYTGVTAYLYKMVARISDGESLDDLMEGIMN